MLDLSNFLMRQGRRQKFSVSNRSCEGFVSGGAKLRLLLWTRFDRGVFMFPSWRYGRSRIVMEGFTESAAGSFGFSMV